MNATQPAALRMIELYVRTQHLGGRQRSTELPAQSAERAVADAGHGGQYHAGTELMGTDLDHGESTGIWKSAMLTAGRYGSPCVTVLVDAVLPCN